MLYVIFALTSIFSFYHDKFDEEKEANKYEQVMSFIFWGSFASFSISLSRITSIRYEVGMFVFYLTCLLTYAMKINLKLTLIAFAYAYVLMSIRVYLAWQLETVQSTDIEAQATLAS